jgi:hypothetical protein
MPESDELQAAQSLVAAGAKDKALPILWKLYVSNDPRIRLDAGLCLLAALNQLTENEKLLEVTERTVEIADSLGKADVRAYLLVNKAQLLFIKLSDLTSRQHNLNLSANVFKWIDFSLEIDKAEFAEIGAERSRLKEEIASLEARALAAIRSSQSHYLRGRVLMSLGEIAFSRFLDDQLDLSIAGRHRSKAMNIHFIRRWHFDRFIGFTRSARRQLKDSQESSFACFKQAIEEFRANGYKTDLAHALYGLAVKLAITYRFRKAQNYLVQAKQLAEAENANALLVHIGELEKRVKDKYRHLRNYVEELGLDLPRGVRGRS